MNAQTNSLNFRIGEGVFDSCRVSDNYLVLNDPIVELLSFNNINLDQSKIDEIMFLTECKLINRKADKATSRKVLLIVIETLQNILHHGHALSKTPELVHFSISIRNNQLYINSVNFIAKNLVDKLVYKLNSILNSSIAEIKKNYMNTLGNGVMTKKGGASLGLLTIILKSNKQIDYNILDLKKEYGLFYLESRVQWDINNCI